MGPTIALVFLHFYIYRLYVPSSAFVTRDIVLQIEYIVMRMSWSVSIGDHVGVLTKRQNSHDRWQQVTQTEACSPYHQRLKDEMRKTSSLAHRSFITSNFCSAAPSQPSSLTSLLELRGLLQNLEFRHHT